MIRNVKKVIFHDGKCFAVIADLKCGGCYFDRRSPCPMPCRTYEGKFRVLKDSTLLKMRDGSVKRFVPDKEHCFILEEVENA